MQPSGIQSVRSKAASSLEDAHLNFPEHGARGEEVAWLDTVCVEGQVYSCLQLALP